MGKCQPGMVCFENTTFFILLFVIVILYVYITNKKEKKHCSNVTLFNDVTPREEPRSISDPYKPPLIDNARLNGSIAFQTTSLQNTYQQVGILNRPSCEQTILPIMGKKLLHRSDKWNYYTMNDKNNMIKLPITFKGKSGTSEYGCDELYSGDKVIVQGYNDEFTVTIYESNMIYTPF